MSSKRKKYILFGIFLTVLFSSFNFNNITFAINEDNQSVENIKEKSKKQTKTRKKPAKNKIKQSQPNTQDVITKDDFKTLSADIEYEDIIKKAHEHCYDLKIADFEVLISKQSIRTARSEYFPKLNFQAGTEYTRNFQF